MKTNGKGDSAGGDLVRCRARVPGFGASQEAACTTVGKIV